jgi:hypothetical protein
MRKIDIGNLAMCFTTRRVQDLSKNMNTVNVTETMSFLDLL